MFSLSLAQNFKTKVLTVPKNLLLEYLTLTRQFGGTVTSPPAANLSSFPSKALLDAWLRQPADKTLAEFIPYFRGVSGLELEERKAAGRRVEYVVALWRMAVVLDTCITTGTGEFTEMNIFAKPCFQCICWSPKRIF